MEMKRRRGLILELERRCRLCLPKSWTKARAWPLLEPERKCVLNISWLLRGRERRRGLDPLMNRRMRRWLGPLEEPK